LLCSHGCILLVAVRNLEPNFFPCMFHLSAVGTMGFL
jgi:hypothetical protein